MPKSLRPEDIQNLFRDLFRFPPALMFGAGLLLAIAGAAICAWGWNKGLVFQAHGILAAGGVALTLLGISNGRKRAEVEKQIHLLEVRGDEIIGRLAEMKKKGGSTFKYLAEQGILDVRLQGLLLKQAES